ncbi:MAG: AMP-binding protein [Actinomycetota bacterium]|nr:AMP-binding protein [Actinomycetota bacterium]
MFVPFNVADFLERAATVYPERVGVIDEPDQPAESWGSLSFKELSGRAKAQAAGLDGLGIDRGERVAVVSHNAARLLTAFSGVSGYGRILVPINFRLTAAEVGYIVEHSGAKALIVDPDLADTLSKVKVDGPRFVMGPESDEELYRFGVEPEPWSSDESAVATLNYTSGTTARPKGVMLSHRSCWVNATSFGWHAAITDRDVYLHTLPMFHANGWGMLWATIGVGVPQVVIRKIDGAEILRRVGRHGVTVMCAAPAVVSAVLGAAPDWDGPIPGRERVRLIVAGAPPPSRTIEQVEEELGWEFIQIYGLTETSPLVTINRTRAEWDDLSGADRARKLVRAGGPAIGTQVKTDAEGEILVRSNMVMEGYWEQPEASAEVLVDGWFRTGDGGFVDDENYLQISDRKKDVIITGGENVSSIEVEDAVFSHPKVAEVAVIGIPDDKWGELVTALITVSPGEELSTEEIVAHCRTLLAGYKCPKQVEFRDTLPRTATGKLQKFKLRAEFWDEGNRRVN